MFTKIIFTILCCISLTIALNKNDFNQCLNTTCFQEKSFCQNDTNCNQYLESWDLCSLTDINCIHKCSIPNLSNPGFWSVNLCAMDCLKNKEKSHTRDIEKCQAEQCFTEILSCSHDKACNDAINSIQKCKKQDFEDDYICAGQHFTENLARSSIMFSLIHCEISCIWKFMS